jgi:hypothetical protein
MRLRQTRISDSLGNTVAEVHGLQITLARLSFKRADFETAVACDRGFEVSKIMKVCNGKS